MKKRFNLVAQDKHVDIYLYGVIGGWDVDLQTFMAQLQSVDKPDTVTVFLNTLGGSFYDGIPIFTHLSMLQAQVTINIMGYALSMGSVLALVDNAKVRMAQNGAIMIHRAQSVSYGSPTDHAKESEVLAKVEAGVVKLYAQRLGITTDQALALMDETTWYSADEALAAGLIDEIIDPIDVAAALDTAKAGLNDPSLISNYHNAPPELLGIFEKPKQSWFAGLLKKSPKPALSNPLPKKQDIEMTEEELKAVLAESNAALATQIETTIDAKLETKLEEKLAALKPKDEATLQAEKIAALEAENAELKKVDPTKRIAELEAENTLLKTPYNHTPSPTNQGADSDKAKFEV